MAALAAAAAALAGARRHAAAALAAARRHATSAPAAARRHTVGYDYATVVERGEWWRLSASLVGPGGLAPLVVMAHAIPCGRGTVADAVWWTAALHSGGCLGASPGRGAAAGTTSRAPRAPPRAGRRNARPTARSARPSRRVASRPRAPPCSLRRPWARRPSRGPSSRPSARPATGVVSPPSGRSWSRRVAQGARGRAPACRRRLRALAAADAPRRRRRAARRRVARRRRRRRPSAPAPEAARSPRAERGRRRVPRALGAHGGPVFPWLVVDDRPRSSLPGFGNELGQSEACAQSLAEGLSMNATLRALAATRGSCHPPARITLSAAAAAAPSVLFPLLSKRPPIGRCTP